MADSQTPHSDWTHNVQMVRLWMPPREDGDHHKSLVNFSKDLDKLLYEWFGPEAIASFTGFYRANKDWDNVDTPDACLNHPDRGDNTEELDNEP